MPTDLDAKFNRLKLSEKDFSEACQYLDCFGQQSDDVVRRALVVAAIVAYSRPFKKSYGSKEQAENSLDLPPSFFSVVEQELHEKIIALRDEGIAHSDYERKPTRRVETDGPGFMTWSKPFDPLTEIRDIVPFRDVASRLKDYCFHQLFQIDRQLKGDGGGAVIRAKGVALREGTQEIGITFKSEDS